jgi:creatinine amidohydrolase
VISALCRSVRCAAALAAALLALAAHAAPVELEALTWPELRERLGAGTKTVLVPVGGTEQNGPHMVLGKHNVRAKFLAERIAERLGDALVAPVVAYVPEGSIDPPSAHMRWPGTISIDDATFEAMLAQAARSLRHHGFREIVFLGDHGGYQRSIERVAARLNREWTPLPGARAVALVEYYRVTQTEYVAALKARGFGAAEIGSHAGLADTSLAMAVDPGLVRSDAWSGAAVPGHGDGIDGDPRRASAQLGRLGIDRIVDASVAAIRAQRNRSR